MQNSPSTPLNLSTSQSAQPSIKQDCSEDGFVMNVVSTPLTNSTPTTSAYLFKQEGAGDQASVTEDDDGDCDQSNSSSSTQASKKRGKYQRISDDTKRLIVQAFEAEENILLVAQEQGIKPRTAYTIVRRAMRGDWPPKNPRGGARHLKVDDEVRACLAKILEVNPQATQEAIRFQLEMQLPMKPKIALSTLSTAMDGLLYEVHSNESVDQASSENQAVITNTQADMRYCEWFVNKRDTLIYVGERAYNVWTRRFQGKKESNVTRKMFHVIGRQRGKNLTVLLGITEEGTSMMEIIQGELNEEIFTRLINKLLEKMKGQYVKFITSNCT